MSTQDKDLPPIAYLGGAADARRSAQSTHAPVQQALEALVEAILTFADPEYARRCMDEAVRVLQARGWSAPVPYDLPKGDRS